MVVGFDLEWSRNKITVLGLAWDEGRRASATNRNVASLHQFLEVLRRADVIVAQNGIDADCQQLAAEGLDTRWLEPKVFDTRLAMHATHAHLAGTGSFDLRSLVLLLNGRHGVRFPLDWKDYADNIFKTCAFDSAAALWVYPTLQRLITRDKLEGTVRTLHRVAPIFARMKQQGVRLDLNVLGQIHADRKEKTIRLIEQYHLWEERGKKVIKRVPIWRSDKILDVFEREFGIRPKDRQRKTLSKLVLDQTIPAGARELAGAVIDLGKGANDAHWLGTAEETDDGLSFDKVGSDGFIYPRYDICGSPDRAIASGPNIQNFPRPGEDPRPVPLRSAIVPLDPSHLLLGVDFSSVETITNAYESHDLDRMRAALTKQITHEGTAELINRAFGLSLNRQQGKAINHGFDKGESPYNLGRTIFQTERPSRVQVNQCKVMYEQMLKEYPKTALFRDQLWERSVENPLVVKNSFGRQLMCFSRAKYGDAGEYFAKHDASKKYWCSCSGCGPRRDRWKYAIAFLGRSCAFDALLQKMLVIWEERRLDEFSLPMIECHDELIFSVAADKATHYAEIVKRTFEEPIPELGGVSLPASAVIGRSWAEAH